MVVGAGPVGLGFAAVIAHAGIDVLVVERDPFPSREWRASTFHPPTLEHLSPLGVTDEMLDKGLIADTYQIRDRGAGLVAEFDYSPLEGDTDFPFRLQLEQYKLVEILTDFLQRAKGAATVRFRSEVSDVATEGDSTVLTVSTPDGTERVRAGYVIGADGARSTVRKLLSVPFPGWTYEQRFLLISTDLPFEHYLPDLCHVNYIADPREFVMLLRIPDVWRVLVPVLPGQDENVASRPDRLRETIEGVVGTGVDWSQTRLPASQLYRVHQRVAESFRVGRVLLIGDAAHVNSPIGGFGLNSGLHDAFDLAIRLTRLLKSEAVGETAVDGVEAELDTFATTRRQVAVDHIQRVSHQNTRVLTQEDESARRRDRTRLAAIANDPLATREWLLEASMITAVREHGIGRPPAESMGTRGSGSKPHE